MRAKSSEDYLRLFQSLLPTGKIWNRTPDSTLTKLLYGLADEFARIEQRSFDLVDESIPSQVDELLEDYENDYGLNQEKLELGKTTAQRVADLLAKFTEYGGTHKEYFEDIATELGYTITLEYFTPFWAGVGVAGDAIGPLVNMFYWKVLIAIEADINYNTERLMSEISKYKPAHTLVLFDWHGRGFSRGFNKGFNSFPEWDNSWGDNSYGKIGDKGLGFSRGFSNGFANAYDYDGIFYTGGFHSGFNIGFNRYSGGGFSKVFSTGFSTPH